jgi:phytoene/squalene synthetase
MNTTTAALARSITKESSKQTYLTTLLLVDNDLVDDCFRAYAYFRWVDDVVDISSQTRDERIAFIQRQKTLIDRLYSNDRPENLTPKEQIIADLISHDRNENSGLQSFIRKFIAIIEFDAYRKGRLISQSELDWYQDCLGKSVTDGIQYFVGNRCFYPESPYHYQAATAAHITHMLRDMVQDIEEGFINIPYEYMEEHYISLGDVSSLPFRAWTQARVELARKHINEGKHYIDELEVLRCKIAAYWYCTRFEVILDTIEHDDYILRREYNQHRKLTTWLKMAWLAFKLTIQHYDCRKIASRREVQDSRLVQY